MWKTLRSLECWVSRRALWRVTWALRVVAVLALLVGTVVAVLPATAQAYEIIDVQDAGSVEGRVMFVGTPPPPRKLLITKDPEVCGGGERVIEDVSVTEEGGLRNVVVYLNGIEHGKAWETVSAQPLLNQRGCRFLPEIAIVPKGKPLAVTNSDPVPHNIHAYEVIGRARRSLFNMAQPQPGTITKSITPRTAPMVKVECDLHNFMEGWVFVAETPYTTLVDAEGKFTLSEIPPGSYTLKAWHPTLGMQEAEVQIESGKTSSASFEFSAQ